MDRKRVIWWLFVSNCIITALNFSLCSAQSLDLKEESFSYLLKPVTPSRPYDITYQRYLFIDLNEDGKDEYVEYINEKAGVTRAPSRLLISEWSRLDVIKDQENIEGKFLGIGSFDVYGNKHKEVVFFELLNNMVYLNICNVENYNPDCLKPIALPNIPIPNNIEATDFDIYPVDVFDWDGDRSLDLLIIIRTNHGYQPRGVWIINISTGKILLKKQIGPQVTNVITHDIDEDGRLELLFGGEALFNCEKWPESERFFNGTDDTKAWVFIVDDDGDFLLKEPTGGLRTETKIFVQDMNHDGVLEVIVLNSELSENNSGSIAFLDIHSKQFIKERTRQERVIPDLVFFDWEEDGKTEFLTLWTNGLLEIRNDENDVVKSIDSQLTNCLGFKVFDLEQDGAKEIAVWGNSGLLLFNNKLEVMMYNPIGVNLLDIVSPGSGQNKNFHIYSGDQSSIFELQTNITRFIYQPQLAIITFVVGVAFTLIGVGIVHRKRRYAILLDQEFSSSVNMFLLDSRGRIEKMGKNAPNLLLSGVPTAKKIHFKRLFDSKEWNPVKQVIARSLHQKTESHNLEVVVTNSSQQRYFILNLILIHTGLFARRHWLLTLQETTELVQSQQALAWASLAQKMAHEIKTPLSTVMLAAQQLQMKIEPNVKTKNKVGKYINHIIEQVNRLRRTTDVFMKFAHIQQLKLQPANLNHIVTLCLAELSGIISTNVEVHRELETELPAVLLDQEQMSIAIKNLLENAINAMENKGILTVTSRMEQLLQKDDIEFHTVVLEISDTGCGIAEDQLNQIFEPFFTMTRGGTGLGLTLVKKIVQDHRGEIHFKSTVGIGTTVIMTLPGKLQDE